MYEFLAGPEHTFLHKRDDTGTSILPCFSILLETVCRSGGPFLRCIQTAYTDVRRMSKAMDGRSRTGSTRRYITANGITFQSTAVSLLTVVTALTPQTETVFILLYACDFLNRSIEFECKSVKHGNVHALILRHSVRIRSTLWKTNRYLRRCLCHGSRMKRPKR